MRKHAKDSGGDGGAGVEVETLEDGADGSSLSFSLVIFLIVLLSCR